MAKPGPKPLPTKLLAARGAYKPHPERLRERENEPRDLDELGPPSDDMSEMDCEAWKYFLGVIPEGVAFEADRPTLEVLCRLWTGFKSGTLDPNSAAARRLDSLLGKFGLNPSDRTRVHQMRKPKKNKFANTG